MSERQRMVAGELHDPMDAGLVTARTRARNLSQLLNASAEAGPARAGEILEELLGAGGALVPMQLPFFCDYGANIELGERVFFNFNCIILDVCPVRIGSFTLFGPSVQIPTPMHPWNAEVAPRRSSANRSRSDRTFGLGRRHQSCRGVRIGARGRDRRRKRRIPRHSGRHVRRRELLPRGAGNRGVGHAEVAFEETKPRSPRCGLTSTGIHMSIIWTIIIGFLAGVVAKFISRWTERAVPASFDDDPRHHRRLRR